MGNITKLLNECLAMHNSILNAVNRYQGDCRNCPGVKAYSKKLIELSNKILISKPFLHKKLMDDIAELPITKPNGSNCVRLRIFGSIHRTLEILEYEGNGFKLPKVFISHSKEDIDIVDCFVDMLGQIGLNPNNLFCSSANGYGIKQGSGDIYNYLQKEFSSNNLFIIYMLSTNYYKSPVCLNEMGAAWVLRSEYQSILLPNFDFPDIKGVVSPRDICFKLEDDNEIKRCLGEMKDNILNKLGLPAVNNSLWERYRDKFLKEVELIKRSN